MKTIAQRIAEELAVNERQVLATMALLDEGSTVPFIARYRKEATGGLDDTQLRALEERLRYLRELDERRATILSSIEEQGKLTDDLAQAIQEADTKTRLEDLYLPYKQKRRTKAQIAREAGLEPLALTLLEKPDTAPEQFAAEFIDKEKGVEDLKQALDGAKQILMEKYAEDAELIGQLREYVWERADVQAQVVAGKEEEGAKFSDYFDHNEPLQDMPSHRALALFRGRNEGILQLNLPVGDESDTKVTHPCEFMIAKQFNIKNQERPADKWLQETVRWGWRHKIRLSLDVELFMRLRERAETEAINVFSNNLKDLLLAAPAGQRSTMGLDPGLRTGVKATIVDNTGKLIAHTTIFPHAPRNQWSESIEILATLSKQHNVDLVSIGNGTASRETDKLVTDIIKAYPDLKLHKIVVSEAGASVYSASELASNEFPDLDVSYRGAVSIARRLQDPLAELVKIDPKSIGVGQYQHDVNQSQLARTLDTVVEDCVNAVGVDVNTASVPLLSRVSGLNAGLAKNIVMYRDEFGAFDSRNTLKKVPRLGEKTFEQAAGFLRIMQGKNPLDASAVHPEAYPVVERIVTDKQQSIDKIIGNSQFLRDLRPEEFVDENFGLPTIQDILAELDKPGRDPRPEFKTAAFKEGVEELDDLQPDMVLEGVVTNVTNFGAFVDIGVHQDGLVHISALADKFIKDPHDVVKAGDVVKVKVLEVDLKRRRVALTMRLADKSKEHISPSMKNESASNSSPKPKAQKASNKPNQPRNKQHKPSSRQPNKRNEPKQPTAMGNALADALANMRK
ncbi:Tex family protein [Candidatus Albibeggiatoa sp. nov. BB20]|uniref:Tex family protein n=1 Tax=Candidatus Albibeggiatoa sp. nov. BB20 TaxID=3162723 RepID=UPI003365A6AF